MSDPELALTSHALATAIPPLANLAVAAGALPDVVDRITGCGRVNTSRVRHQPFDRLVDKVNQALAATNCLPLLHVHINSGANTRQALGPAASQLFADELIRMADALQRMKYALRVEIDVRGSQRRNRLRKTEDWKARVVPHLIEAGRLSDVIAELASLFEHTRMDYVELLKNTQVPWHSPLRRQMRQSLFVSQHKIADLLEMHAASVRFACQEARQLVPGLSAAAIRQYDGALKALSTRLWDHRVLAESGKVFRRTTPARNPLIDFLVPKPQLERVRQRVQFDYERAAPGLRRFIDATESCGKDAMNARNALLGVAPTHANDALHDLATDLGHGRVLRICTGSTKSAEPSTLFSIPHIAVERC